MILSLAGHSRLLHQFSASAVAIPDNKIAPCRFVCKRHQPATWTAVQIAMIQQESHCRLLWDSDFLTEIPDTGVILRIYKGVEVVCLGLRRIQLFADTLKLLSLGYKLLRQSLDDLRMLNHLIQNRIAHIHTMLSDGRENFIKHPVFKSFCRWQLAVNDQPVNIAFCDKGDFNDLLSSISILIHLLNDPLAFR